jgi:hypothetical protein
MSAKEEVFRENEARRYSGVPPESFMVIVSHLAGLYGRELH